MQANTAKVVSVQTMRDSDARTIAEHTPSAELMLRAAKGIFDSVSFAGKIAVVCGAGNNGGDGYALACILKENGFSPIIFRVADRFSEDGKMYYLKALSLGCEEESLSAYSSLSGFDIIVDCILGTGFKGEPKPEIREAIDKINSSGAYVISADINSGMDGDTGLADAAVHSDLTVSIGSYKTGMFLGDAPSLIDSLRNAEIGIEIIGDSGNYLSYEMLHLFEGYASEVMSFPEFYAKTGLNPHSTGIIDTVRELSSARGGPVVVKGEHSAVIGDMSYVYFCADYT